MYSLFARPREFAASYSLEELSEGMSAADTVLILSKTIHRIALASRDYNPIHFDSKYAENTIFKEPIAHGLIIDGILSYLLGMKLPGKGTILLKKEVSFYNPVLIWDTLESKIEIKKIDREKRNIELRGSSWKDKNTQVAELYAKVMLDKSQG